MNRHSDRKLSVIKEEILEDMYQIRRASMIRGVSNGRLLITQDYDAEEEENVEKLFERISQNINLKDEEGKAPICKAIEENHIKLVEYLIEHKADLSHVNPEDQTAFALARELGRIEITEYLEKISEEGTKDTIEPNIEALGQALESSAITEEI